MSWVVADVFCDTRRDTGNLMNGSGDFVFVEGSTRHTMLLLRRARFITQVVAAVDGAVAYLDSVKITGIKVEDRKQEGTPKGFERYVVKDPDAPPMWARFYEIGTNKPIFAGFVSGRPS